MPQRFARAAVWVGLLSLAPSFPVRAQDNSKSDLTVVYSKFPSDEAKSSFTKPPAPVGTVEYNKWLGQMFNGVLFNESSPDKQKEIADQIVDEDYLQHNKLVATGRKGLLGFM